MDSFLGSLTKTEPIAISELTQRFQNSNLAYKNELIKGLSEVPVESFELNDVRRFIEIVVQNAKKREAESRRISSVFDQNATARFDSALNSWKSKEDILHKSEVHEEGKGFSFLNNNDNPFGTNKDEIKQNKAEFSFSNSEKNTLDFHSPNKDAKDLYLVSNNSNSFEDLKQPVIEGDLKLSDLTKQSYSFLKSESLVEEVDKKPVTFSFLDQFANSSSEADSFRLSTNDSPQDEDSFDLNKEKENSFNLSKILKQESPEESANESKSFDLEKNDTAFKSDKKAYVPSKLSENILPETDSPSILHRYSPSLKTALKTEIRTPSKVTFDKSALDSTKSSKSKYSDSSFSNSLFDASLNKVLNKSMYDESGFQIGSFDNLQNGRQNLENIENIYETNDFPVHTPEQKQSSIPLPRSKKTPIPEILLDYKSPIEKMGGMVGYEEKFSPTKGDQQLQNSLKDLQLLEEKYQQLKIEKEKQSLELKNQKIIVKEVKKCNERLQNENYSLELSKAELESLVRIKTNEVGNIVKKYTGNRKLIDLQQELMEHQTLESSKSVGNNQLKSHCEKLEDQLEDLRKESESKDVKLIEVKEELESLKITFKNMETIGKEISQISIQTDPFVKEIFSVSVQTKETDGIGGSSIATQSEFFNIMAWTQTEGAAFEFVCTQTDSPKTSNIETNTAIRTMVNQDTCTGPYLLDSIRTRDNLTSVYIQTSTIENNVSNKINDRVFETIAVQTDDLNLDISCVQMQELDISTINPYENDLDVKFNNLTEEIEKYNTQKQELKTQIHECQSQTMSIRKELDVRARYDQEMERWIENLLKKVLTTQQEVGIIMVQFEKERKRGKMLWERFQALKSQKVNVRTQTKVSGVVSIGIKGVQTDKGLGDLGVLDLQTITSNVDASIKTIENGMIIPEKIEMRWTKILNFLMIMVSCFASYVIFVQKWVAREVQEEIMVVI